MLLLQGNLVFLPVSYSLMAEAADSVASASAAAFLLPLVLGPLWLRLLVLLPSLCGRRLL
jgi:hypothetical protein